MTLFINLAINHEKSIKYYLQNLLILDIGMEMGRANKQKH